MNFPTQYLYTCLCLLFLPALFKSLGIQVSDTLPWLAINYKLYSAGLSLLYIKHKKMHGFHLLVPQQEPVPPLAPNPTFIAKQ